MYTVTPGYNFAVLRDGKPFIHVSYAASDGVTAEEAAGFVRQAVGLMNEGRKVLQQLVDTVEATGGVREDKRSGRYAPVGDDTWTDLGSVYVEACLALGRSPMIEPPYRVED